jgi:hypothetical protein
MRIDETRTYDQVGGINRPGGTLFDVADFDHLASADSNVRRIRWGTGTVHYFAIFNHQVVRHGRFPFCGGEQNFDPR